MSLGARRLVRGLALALMSTSAAAQVSVENEVGSLLQSASSSLGGLGTAVGLDGERAVVGWSGWSGGGIGLQGAAWIYHWTGAAWVEEQPLLSSTPGLMDEFGATVALFGDVVVVGAPGSLINPFQQSGQAFVYRRVGGAWVEEQELHGLATQKGNRFGDAVAVDGDVLIVGAPYDNAPLADQGSATIYRWNGAAWQLEQTLVASNASMNAHFGEDVAIQGDVALVGSPDATVGASTKQGAAYVFRWNGAAWVEEQILSASDGSPFDLFGTSVALDGDVAVIGIMQDDVGDHVEQGSAWVFRHDGATWQPEQHLLAANGTAGEHGGIDVALSGDVIVVGAPDHEVAGQLMAGTAHAFRHGSTGWAEESQLLATDADGLDRLGFSVAVAGDIVFTGVPGDAGNGSGVAGSVRVFDLLGDAWTSLGQALPGSQGAPALSAFGDLSAGSSVTFTLSHAAASAPVYAVLGLASLGAPFKGGVLVPTPDVVLGGLVTSADGHLTLAAVWPAGVPAGVSFWVQDWLVDPAGPKGFAASNAVMGTSP